MESTPDISKDQEKAIHSNINTIEGGASSLCQIVDVHGEIKTNTHLLEKESCGAAQTEDENPQSKAEDGASKNNLPNVRETKEEESLQPEEQLESDFENLQKVSTEIDDVFKNHISQLEHNTPNDLELQIKALQKWSQSLLNRCNVMNNAMKTVSVEAETRSKSSRDRDVLVKFIQDAFHKGKWNIDDLKLKTEGLEEFLKNDLVKNSGDSSEE